MPPGWASSAALAAWLPPHVQWAALLAQAAGSTLVNLLLAVPLCLFRRGPGLPTLWLAVAPCLGALLLAAHRGRVTLAVSAALLLLPVTVVCLRDAWRDRPVLWRAATSSGAGWWAALRYAVLRPALPGLLLAVLSVSVCSAALLAATLAALGTTP